jgi:hypothetical protein
MTVTIAFDQAKAESTLKGEMPDGSGVGVNYVDVIVKASKLTLPDGRKLLLKRKGLKLTLAIGDKQARRCCAASSTVPTFARLIAQALEAAALAAGAKARLEAGALHLDVD